MAVSRQGLQQNLEGLDGLEVNVSITVDPGVLVDFPLELARDYGVVPLSRSGDQFVVAQSRPLRPEQLRALSFRVGRPIHVISAFISDFEAVLEELEDKSAEARKLGEILTEEQLVSESELQEALARQESDPKRLGEILVDLGFLSEEELRITLEKQENENRTCFDPSLFVDTDVLLRIPEKLARKYQLLPLAHTGEELLVAAPASMNGEVPDEIAGVVEEELKVVAVDGDELHAAINQCYLRLRRLELGDLRLGDLLQLRGIVTQDQIEECLVEQKSSNEKLGEVLVRKGYATEEEVFSCLSEKLGYEFRRFKPSEIDPTLADLVSRRFAERHLVIPIRIEDGSDSLVVAMVNPEDLKVRDMLDRVTRERDLQLVPVLSTPSTIREAIQFTYQSRELMEEVETEPEEESTPALSEPMLSSDEMSGIRQLVNRVLYQAVLDRASDVHIENGEDRVRVRYRIDGILEERQTAINKGNIRKVISVLKIDSGLDIAERRRSQDGVFKKRVSEDHIVDFRINVHATKSGEDAVIRILDRDRNLLPLGELGLSEQMHERYLSIVDNPQGLILFTGPTGSGKTTTLYSTLDHLNTGHRKIVTAEDPVEYNLDGISQYQVNDAIGNTFAEYARRFLRKDPDIILVGEIRDRETADACVSAAMTGHLVFSTLHTNDSIGVVQRLADLGVDASSMADSLQAVISQRLARRVCPDCATTYEPDPRVVWEFFEDDLPDGVEFIRGSGCESCQDNGYRGRVGLYEFWELSPDVRRAIASSAGESELEETARDDGMQPLLVDALRKVGSGTTTLEELRRVVPLEQIRAFARQ